MSIKFKRHVIVSIIASLLVFIIAYQTAFAGSSASSPFAGGTARAYKWNTTISSIQWRAEITSWCDGCGAIDVIGWTWWHVYEICGGYTIDYKTLAPVAATNTNYQQRHYYQAFNSCSNSTKITGNKGSHRYTENGSTIYLAPEFTKSFP